MSVRHCNVQQLHRTNIRRADKEHRSGTRSLGDGSGWKGVYDILVKDGFNVSIVQEPETSFREDVAATKHVLSLQRATITTLAMRDSPFLRLLVSDQAADSPSVKRVARRGAFSASPRRRATSNVDSRHRFEWRVI